MRLEVGGALEFGEGWEVGGEKEPNFAEAAVSKVGKALCLNTQQTYLTSACWYYCGSCGSFNTSLIISLQVHL